MQSVHLTAILNPIGSAHKTDAFSIRLSIVFQSPRRSTPSKIRPASRGRIAAAVAAFALLAGCDKQVPPPPPAPPEVGVVTLAPQAVSITTDLPGRVNPFLVAEVRARVDGIVLKRLFVEGSDVKQGQVLFQIDPAPYQATLDSAEASLQKAKATLASSQAQAARYKILVKANAVSKQDYINATSAAAPSRSGYCRRQGTSRERPNQSGLYRSESADLGTDRPDRRHRRRLCSRRVPPR